MKRFKVSVKARERRTLSAQACACDDISCDAVAPEVTPRRASERTERRHPRPSERRSVSPLS